MKVGDKVLVKRGDYVGREVYLYELHPDFEGFWLCAVPIQRRDRRTGEMRDTAAAVEALLSVGQLSPLPK